MARLPRTFHLTGSGNRELDREQRQTYCGQAHFAVGPEQCSTCAFLGYWQQVCNAAGDVVRTQERKSSCRRYFELTGCHGASIPGNALACRHYEKREG